MTRINNQKELKESEERFRTIAESLPVQISITGINDSKIKFTNESYNKTFGFNGVDLVGHPAEDLYYYPNERNKVIEILKRDGRVSDLETMVKKSDGTPFWVSASIQKINYSFLTGRAPGPKAFLQSPQPLS
jgi:PAS domain S-box-containing protein